MYGISACGLLTENGGPVVSLKTEPMRLCSHG